MHDAVLHWKACCTSCSPSCRPPLVLCFSPCLDKHHNQQAAANSAWTIGLCTSLKIGNLGALVHQKVCHIWWMESGQALYWEKPLLNWQPLFDLYTPCCPWLTHRLSSTECLWAWYRQDHSAHLAPPIHRKHCHLTYRILAFSDFPLHWHVVAHFEGWRSSPSSTIMTSMSHSERELLQWALWLHLVPMKTCHVHGYLNPIRLASIPILRWHWGCSCWCCLLILGSNWIVVMDGGGNLLQQKCHYRSCSVATSPHGQRADRALSHPQKIQNSLRERHHPAPP